MGKTDKPRPMSISREEFAKRWPLDPKRCKKCGQLGGHQKWCHAGDDDA